jgi:hypothetical protein
MNKSLRIVQKNFFDQVTTPGSLVPVYSEGYRLRLIEAVEDDFATSLSALGAQTRKNLFDDFFVRFQSTSFTLNTLGVSWLQFLRETQVELPPWFLALAEFEWAQVLCFYRGGTRSRAAERTFVVSDDPVYGFSLARGVTVHHFAWPVADIFAELKLRDEQNDACARHSNTSIDQTTLATMPEHQILALWFNEEVSWAALSRDGAELFEMMLAAESWGDVEAQVVRRWDEAQSSLKNDSSDSDLILVKISERLQIAMTELSQKNILKPLTAASPQAH